MRQGDWKLVVYRGGRDNEELFDLARDPYEKENLAQHFPERVQQLKQVMAQQAGNDGDACRKLKSLYPKIFDKALAIFLVIIQFDVCPVGWYNHQIEFVGRTTLQFAPYAE